MPLVISRNLVLNDPNQFDVNSPIIGYDNWVDVTNISASSEDASGSYPATNLANPATYLYWKASSSAAQSIVYDNRTNAVDIDYVGIARHNFGTAQATVQILGSTSLSGGNPVYDTTLTDEILPADDTPLMFRFTKNTYYAIKIVISAANQAVRAAVVYSGSLLALQRKIYVGHTPVSMARATSVVNGFSESGQFLGRLLIGEQRASSVSMKNLTPDWYRAYFDKFAKAAMLVPWFFAWRPSDYPLETGYVWLTGDPKMTNQLPNGLVSVDFSFSGVA